MNNKFLKRMDEMKTLLLSSLILISCQSSKNEIKKAEDFIDIERYDLAEAILEDQIKKEPKNSEVHMMLGKVYLMKRDVTSAEKSFKTCLLIDGDSKLKIAEEYLKVASTMFDNQTYSFGDDLVEMAKRYNPEISSRMTTYFLDQAYKDIENNPEISSKTIRSIDRALKYISPSKEMETRKAIFEKLVFYSSDRKSKSLLESSVVLALKAYEIHQSGADRVIPILEYVYFYVNEHDLKTSFSIKSLEKKLLIIKPTLRDSADFIFYSKINNNNIESLSLKMLEEFSRDYPDNENAPIVCEYVIEKFIFDLDTEKANEWLAYCKRKYAKSGKFRKIGELENTLI